jgi:hypothetical protein
MICSKNLFAQITWTESRFFINVQVTLLFIYTFLQQKFDEFLLLEQCMHEEKMQVTDAYVILFTQNIQKIG